MTNSTAIIGGTGLEKAGFFKTLSVHEITTPYGKPSSKIIELKIDAARGFFLSRHGKEHTIAPHKVNYRANIWALNSLGVKNIIAVAAVGGISENMVPKTIMLPDQIIDYTWGREHTFFAEDKVEHIDFTRPYCQCLRQKLLDICGKLQIPVNPQGVYCATQGPRLESKAEIKRLAKDSCDIVGMTAMPEASLARELNMCYATIAVSANWAAGITPDVITMDKIAENLRSGMVGVVKIIEKYFLKERYHVI